MTYAKELINNMWTNFSVEDYIQFENVNLPVLEKNNERDRKNGCQVTQYWPFQMTVREQEEKEESMKSKSDIEMVHKLLKKQEEESECRKIPSQPSSCISLFSPLSWYSQAKWGRRRAMKEKQSSFSLSKAL